MAKRNRKRQKITLDRIFEMFPDDQAAQDWFTVQFWPDGPQCPYCDTHNVQCNIKHKTMTHRCRECQNRPMFSLKTGTLLEGSKLGYRKWAIAVYLLTTNLKSVASTKLENDLGITQKSAWHLAHRIRKAFEVDGGLFEGPVECDETYVGGRRRNMPKSKRAQLDGRGPVGKVAVAGMKDRATKRVRGQVVEHTDAETLQGFVRGGVKAGASVFTDEAHAYDGLVDFGHESVKHSVAEYVRGAVHTNGIESFWSMLKRAHKGTFHQLSAKHLHRYIEEFVGRHNLRPLDTISQMALLTRGLKHKRLQFSDLTA